jgi:hypothetical protein
MEAIKSQLITISMVKGGSMYEMVFSIIALSVIEYIFKIIPVIGLFIQNFLSTFIRRKKDEILTQISLDKTASLIFEKYTQNTNVTLTDSIVDFLSNFDGVKYIRYSGYFFVNNMNEIDIGEDIKAKVIDSKYSSSEPYELKYFSIELYSYKKSLKDLLTFVDTVNYNFTIKRQNKLGSQIYYFDEIIQPIPLDNVGGCLAYSQAKKSCLFSMTPFYTTKNLNNIYGENVKLISKRLNFFLNNRKWYESKGIPYTFGLLLSGDPGCGKTSLIKAISKSTDRHIINISLHNFSTRTQLNNLFYSDKIYVQKEQAQQPEMFIIPCEKRIYIMEDVDCASDVVLQRTGINQDKESIQKEASQKEGIQKEEKIVLQKKEKKADFEDKYKNMRTKTQSDEITLSYLLNLFDGTLEIPGRIVILTTNYPEKLDTALTRAGRIDIIAKFGKCSKDTTIEIVKNFYDIDTLDEEKIENEKFTPAEIIQNLFKNYDNKEEGIRLLQS